MNGRKRKTKKTSIQVSRHFLSFRNIEDLDPTPSQQPPSLQLRAQNSAHPLLHRLKILAGRHILVLLAARDGQVLGHDALAVDDVDAGLLERLGELDDLGRAVELAALGEAARPGEDGRDRVGRGRVAFLVLAVVARHGAVRGFGFEGLAVGCYEDGGHQAQGAEALGYDVGLHVAVVVCGRC
jgi:hypothetical protein